MPDCFDLVIYGVIVAWIESGVSDFGAGYTVTNPSSTAYGRYQLINAVFQDFIGKVDHSKISQERAFWLLTNRNINALKNRSLPVTYENLYALHNQGTTGGIRKITQPDNTYMDWVSGKVSAARKALGV